MDMLKSVMGGKKKENTTSSSGQQDYGDKAAGFLNKKFFGGKLSRDQQEKGTDFLRNTYEKSSGKKVDPKYSN
jgi:hypothetical protein